MPKIYIKDANGRKIYVEVTEKQAQAYREELRYEWRIAANEKNHTVSLNAITDAGHDFCDETSDIDEWLEENERKAIEKAMLKKLKTVLPELTPLQQKTIHKLFVLNKTQAEIAREEGITRGTVKERVDGIYKKLRKLLEKN